MQNQRKLEQVLDERAQQSWSVLSDCCQNGMNLNEAEEIALPYILLRSEREEDEAERELRQQEHEQSEIELFVREASENDVARLKADLKARLDRMQLQMPDPPRQKDNPTDE